ncbi:uncharacterized protein LOC143735319 [Siphateles boraxobius]|uniref:uncharacterized protein LOC143735319 n=1 Tax=Siphateles boraxobius TaxID=180520 RepID=UPI004063C94D
MFHMLVLFCLCWWRLTGVLCVETVSVMEGDSVLLHNDVTEIHEDDDMVWIFGAEKTFIAKMNKRKQIFSTFNGPDGRFRDRLKLDHQTGSLTIANTRTEHVGYYQLLISGAKRSSKTFRVSVYARLNNPISNQTQPLNITHTCAEVHVHCCNTTEAVIRLVISALVGVATVAILVYDIRSTRG